MKIGIDASRAFREKRTGVEEYSYQVIKHLAKYLKDSQVVLYVNLTNYEFIRRACRQAGMYEHANWIPTNWKIKIIRWPRFWTQIGLSLEMLFHPVDVLFVPSHVVPLIHPKNTFVTIHGLEYEIYPAGYSFWERLYMRWSVKHSCRAAKKIIAVSKNTKKDLVKIYKIPEEKIEVVLEGAPEKLQTLPTGRQANSKLKISNFKPYLLFIGRLEKRKNIEGIIEAYEMLKKKNNMPHNLVLVGSSGLGYENIKHKVGSSRYKANIILPGFVSEEEKYVLLKNADVFLFPSFYEGFGLPIVEAQSVGTPILVSNVSSLPEVAGEGAAYCDPDEPKSISDGILAIVSDENYRNGIIEKGYRNVERFSWEKCAENVAGVILR